MHRPAALLAAAGLVLLTPAAAQDVETAPDRGWVSVSGEVVVAGDDDFTLDYGPATITVEMDDWDDYSEGQFITMGDAVTVVGRVDDDRYENRSIEASHVYVWNSDTYYYADSADEEGGYLFHFRQRAEPDDGAQVSVSGVIESVDGREFVLSQTGGGAIQIDTGAMAYNPLDDLGLQQLRVGDYVLVRGRLDIDFWERREIQAQRISRLVSETTRL